MFLRPKLLHFILLISISCTPFVDAAGQVRLVFFGDSLTSGYGLEPAQAYPELLGEMLRNEGIEVEIRNAGLSGETTAGGVRRLDWILRQPVDVLFIALGGNDLLRGLPVEQTENNLRTMVEKARATQPAATVVLLGMQAPSSLGDDYAESFSSIYGRLAADLNTPLFPFLLQDVGGIHNLNQADGIHPNAQGHEVIARNLLPFVRELLNGQKEPAL